MATQLFRQEAIEAGRHRLVGTVVAAVPPGSRVYTVVAAVVGTALVAMLCLGSYSSRQQVRGLIAYDHGVARVYPPAAAEIRAVHVRAGAAGGRTGAPLLTISLSPGRDASGEGHGEPARSDARSRMRNWRGSSSSPMRSPLPRAWRWRSSATAPPRRSPRSNGSGASRAIRWRWPRATASARRASRARAPAASARSRRAAPPCSRGARRPRALEERLISQRETLRGLDAQIEQKRIGAQRTRSEIAGRRAALAEARAGLIRQDHLVLTAPVGGDVGEIVGQVGQRARPDASLVTIVPANSRLEAWLYAPSRAIGFVRVGQEVRLLLDAFPFQKYGAVRGRIVAVSRVATDPTAIDPGLDLKEPVFRIRVRAESGHARAPRPMPARCARA